MTKLLPLIVFLTTSFGFSNTNVLGSLALETIGKVNNGKAGETHETAHRKYCMSFDRNGDGELNQAERSAYKQARKNDLIRRFDADKNGTLDKKEKLTAKATLKNQLEKCSNNYSLVYDTH